MEDAFNQVGKKDSDREHTEDKILLFEHLML